MAKHDYLNMSRADAQKLTPGFKAAWSRANRKGSAGTVRGKGFTALEAADSLEIKRQERNIVRDHIERRADDKLVLFSLPASQWIMEHEIVKAFPDTRFFAAEMVEATCDDAVTNAPTNAIIYHEKAEDALADIAEFEGNVINALWFDAMGWVSGPYFEPFINQLPSVLDFSAGPVPAVFTFSRNRESLKREVFNSCSRQHEAARAEALVRMCRAVGLDFVVDDWRPYRSDDGNSLMVNVLGHITPAPTRNRRGRPTTTWDGLVGSGAATKDEFTALLKSWDPEDIAPELGYGVPTIKNYASGARVPSNVVRVLARKLLDKQPPTAKQSRRRRAAARAHQTIRHNNETVAYAEALTLLAKAMCKGKGKVRARFLSRAVAQIETLR